MASAECQCLDNTLKLHTSETTQCLMCVDCLCICLKFDLCLALVDIGVSISYTGCQTSMLTSDIGNCLYLISTLPCFINIALFCLVT